MGRKHDEIWQSINELDDRLTRLEDRAILKPEYDPADVALTPPRPWRVGDVVRLERFEDCHHRPVGHEGKIYRLDVDGRVGVEPHWMWPASALTLIRPAAPVDDTIKVGDWVRTERFENKLGLSFSSRFMGHLCGESGRVVDVASNGDLHVQHNTSTCPYWWPQSACTKVAAPVDEVAELLRDKHLLEATIHELRAENARLGSELGASTIRFNELESECERLRVDLEAHRDSYAQMCGLLETVTAERDALRARIEAAPLHSNEPFTDAQLAVSRELAAQAHMADCVLVHKPLFDSLMEAKASIDCRTPGARAMRGQA